MTATISNVQLGEAWQHVMCTAMINDASADACSSLFKNASRSDGVQILAQRVADALGIGSGGRVPTRGDGHTLENDGEQGSGGLQASEGDQAFADPTNGSPLTPNPQDGGQYGALHKCQNRVVKNL